MPANAGIQVRFFEFKFETRLDSGFRPNDRNKSRLPVDKFTTPRLRAEGRSVPLFLFTQLAHMGNQAVDLIRIQAALERRHGVLAVADHFRQLRVGLLLHLR